MRNENYNLASAVTVSEKSGAISGNQWLPEILNLFIVIDLDLVECRQRNLYTIIS